MRWRTTPRASWRSRTDTKTCAAAFWRYAYDHDEASAKENGEVANKAITTLREAAEATLWEDRRKLYNGLQADVAATQNVTQSLFAAVKQMRAEQEKLYEVGNEVSETTNAI